MLLLLSCSPNTINLISNTPIQHAMAVLALPYGILFESISEFQSICKDIKTYPPLTSVATATVTTVRARASAMYEHKSILLHYRIINGKIIQPFRYVCVCVWMWEILCDWKYHYNRKFLRFTFVAIVTDMADEPVGCMIKRFNNIIRFEHLRIKILIKFKVLQAMWKAHFRLWFQRLITK